MLKPGLIGLIIALCYLGFEFGAEISRYRATVRALAVLETCGTSEACESAWADFRAISGAGSIQVGQSAEWIDGTVCDLCGAPLKGAR